MPVRTFYTLICYTNVHVVSNVYEYSSESICAEIFQQMVATKNPAPLSPEPFGTNRLAQEEHEHF